MPANPERLSRRSVLPTRQLLAAAIKRKAELLVDRFPYAGSRHQIPGENFVEPPDEERARDAK